jgi:MinD superfamily P-loop ATPase
VTAAFAALAKNVVLCDADVDAADLHLIMAPSVRQEHPFQAGNTAIINTDRCSECGLCRELCRWNAISADFVVDAIDCEGCGVCVDFCPEAAIDFPVKTCGRWFLSDTRFGPMVHASLGIAEENSGKLVSLVRQEGGKLATEVNSDLILTDGPPGVGCPVIAAIGGAHGVLVVTEPSVSGVHDMERVVGLADFFKVPVMLCVNKADINPEATGRIAGWAAEKGLPFVGEIPFDPVFTHAMVQGQTIFEYAPGASAAESVRNLWQRVSDRVMNG